MVVLKAPEKRDYPTSLRQTPPGGAVEIYKKTNTSRFPSFSPLHQYVARHENYVPAGKCWFPQ